MLRARPYGIFLSLLMLVTLFISDAYSEQKCEDWATRVVSVQGKVVVKKAGETKWGSVQLGDTYCAGDTISVPERSRAALLLRNDSLLRIDQNTTVTLLGVEREKHSVLELLNGAVLFFNRFPAGLTVNTPFVNAHVEGTEFFVNVGRTRALVTVFEGRVSASNNMGRVVLEKGQTAEAGSGQPPSQRAVAQPRDAVKWALYYPPIPDYRLETLSADLTGWRPSVLKSLDFYRSGDLSGAFEAIEKVPAADDPIFYTYRALLLLSVGRVDEASADLARALELNPQESYAFALRAIIAVAQNKKERALELARRAVDLDPSSSAALVALSYAQQASFDLKGTLKSIEQAVSVNPRDAHAWARLAELQLSFGYADKALDAAQRATDIDPRLSRTQTVLGYAYLSQIRTAEAKKAFRKAITLDQADPLPRLGLGLAVIRDGDLKEGRRQIEIAAILDPDNSLIRSYLGKAYFDEKRDKQAANQFDQAKVLDPLDPTPWFYEAIQKETQNRPVEALDHLEKSIRLNDNRAVYRSRLLLDQDLAARSASLARIYQDLGFGQRAMVEGWKSLNTDPANYSAHRFLSDAYATMPRHDIARVSELLQSQLLQPLNINPVQPQMGERNLLLPNAFGPAGASFNEYNALFTRNRVDALLTGVAGSHGTLADEVILSGVYENYSASIGQFHHQSDGLFENNDLRRNVYNAFFQTMLAPNLSFLTEYRNTNFLSGDLTRFFSGQSDGLRNSRDTESIRFGMHAALSPRSDLIGHFIYRDFTEDRVFPGFGIATDLRAFNTEFQYLYRSERFNAVAGGGMIEIDRTGTINGFIPIPKDHLRHQNAYLYTYLNWPENFAWTLGASGNFAENIAFGSDRDQFNPKFGVTWNPRPETTIRAAVFRSLMGSGISEGLYAGETIEPTQVAGFNQFFDDTQGTRSWRYGAGIDQKFTTRLHGGIEYSERDLEMPNLVSVINDIVIADRKERLVRAYLYWTPHPWLALGPEYQFERVEDDEILVSNELAELNTHRLIMGASLFHPSGFFAQLRPTMVFQDGRFVQEFRDFPLPAIFRRDHSNFFVLDAAVGYRLPKRLGIISIEAKNLFDKSFKFQESDPHSMTVFPERWILGRVTLFF
ncbi:MAG: tetratricopeptide repeat protein [Syntrophobacteraceae bacterium]